MLTKEQLKEMAKKAQKEQSHIYLIEGNKEINTIITDKFLHYEKNFDFIAVLLPESILKHDYAIYKGWEMNINNFVERFNNDYLI